MEGAAASCRKGPRRVAVAVLLAALGSPRAGAAADDGAEAGVAVTVERVAGDPVGGRLVHVDEQVVRVDVAGTVESLPIETVRRIVRQAADAGAAEVDDVGVMLTDGSRLTGDRFVWEGASATIARGDAVAVLPAERLRMIAWPAPAEGVDPPWLALLPEPADSDVVVVRSGESFDCVACALGGVGEDAVTVMLDGETIPVRRDKVVGLRWLRDAASVGGIAVRVAGGAVQAATITWSPAGLVLDGGLRMPADWLREIDYAAGRTVSLSGLSAERVEVEPFFAGLAEVDGLATFFAPRPVPGEAGLGGFGGVVIRPRTRATWRVPQDARRFRAVAVPATPVAGDGAADVGMVTIVLDGREVHRQAVVARDGPAAGDASPRPIDVDVSAGRRLEILVDFPDAGGMGGPVLLRTPAFEK